MATRRTAKADDAPGVWQQAQAHGNGLASKSSQSHN